MNVELADRIEGYINRGWNLKSYSDYDAWIRRLTAFLNVVIEKEAIASIEKLGGIDSVEEWQQYRDRQVSHLEGLTLKLQAAAAKVADQETKPSLVAVQPASPPTSTKKVFVVHGHDESAKEMTARFLERLDLEAIVLHEQANKGQTIIEKFETHANVGFAVVLLTPDDIGSSAKAPDKLQPRARQNVVLELGYFTGRLGRKRVCGLFKPGVEIPSDFHGVLFIEIDAQGGWKTKLAQELVSAGLQINLQGLLHS